MNLLLAPLRAGPLVVERPLWVLGLVPLALVLALVRPRPADGWDSAFDPALLVFLRGTAARARPTRRRLLAALGVLVTVALAGPALEGPGPAPLRPDAGLVVAVDVSPSMALADVAPVRMAAARGEAAEAIAASGARQVAIVVFAGDAYLLSPFSTDPAVSLAALGAIESGMVPERGSRPAAGLTLAARLIEEAGLADGRILLVSDGGGVDEAALALARAGGRRVDTALAGPAPEAERLRALAREAGGGCACDGATSVTDLLDTAGWSLKVLREDGRGLRGAATTPLLWPLLLPALVLAGLLFGRRRA